MEIERCYRVTTRRNFLTASIAFGLFGKLPPPEGEKRVFDVAGYKIPAVDPNHEGMVVADLKALSAKSAVIINPSLNLVTTLRRNNIETIIRPYFRHNLLNVSILERYLNYPGRLIWLPFVEPDLPEEIAERDQDSGECQAKGAIKRIVHDPEEFAIKHFVPAAKMILNRAGGGGDLILTPPTAQWRDRNEYEFSEAVYRMVKKRLPVQNIGIAQHRYIRNAQQKRADEDREWSRNIALYKMSTIIFEQELPLIITEAGLYQDSTSSFSAAEVADATEKFMMSNIPQPIKRPIKSVNFWNLGYLAYAPNEFHDPTICNRDQILTFDKAALRKADGKTEAFLTIEKLAQKTLSLQR